MKRYTDWERRLAEWAESVRGRPFVWGETDCVSLARAAHVALGGEDPAPKVAYTDLKGALKYLKRHPFAEWLAQAGALEVQGGFPFAQSGDLGVGQDPEHAELPAVAVVLGPLWLITDQTDGVQIGRAVPPWHAALYRIAPEHFVDG